MFSAKLKKRIQELESIQTTLHSEIWKQHEEINDHKRKLSIYESGDYLKISNLLRNELGLAEMDVDFTPQRPDEKDIHHYFYGKTQDEIKEMLASAYTITNTPLFTALARYLLNKQGNYTVLASRNRDEDLLSRGEMSGIASFVIEFQALAKEHVAINAPQQGFDDKEII